MRQIIKHETTKLIEFWSEVVRFETSERQEDGRQEMNNAIFLSCISCTDAAWIIGATSMDEASVRFRRITAS